MLPPQCSKWIAFGVMLSLAHVETASADAWTTSGDCGCGSPNVPIGSQAFWMRPTPVYNSSWSRVPVTNYRPQVVSDPITGVGFTSIQPCNTYEWQPRRTPGSSFCQCLVNWWRSHCGCCCRRQSPCGCGPLPVNQRMDCQFLGVDGHAVLHPVNSGGTSDEWATGSCSNQPTTNNSGSRRHPTTTFAATCRP